MLYFSNDGSRRLNSETATIPTSTNKCVGTMLKRRMVSPSVLHSILLTILILPTRGHAIYLSQLSGFLYNGNSLAAIRDALSQHGARIPPFHSIDQGLTYATNKADTVNLEDKVGQTVSRKLSGFDGDAATSALLAAGNGVISTSADIVTSKVKAVVAATLLGSSSRRVSPISSSTLEKILREKTDSVTRDRLSDVLPGESHATVSDDRLGGLTHRAQYFLSRKPGGRFDSGFRSEEQGPCVNQSASGRLNLTSVAYDYPQNTINLELRERPEVMLEIYRSRRANLPELTQRSGPRSECLSTKETLEAFQAEGARCWVVFSRHQNVQFYRCGSARCGGGGTYVCSSSDKVIELWAWCDTTSADHKIVKVQLPLPISCRCERATSC